MKKAKKTVKKAVVKKAVVRRAVKKAIVRNALKKRLIQSLLPEAGSLPTSPLSDASQASEDQGS